MDTENSKASQQGLWITVNITFIVMIFTTTKKNSQSKEGIHCQWKTWTKRAINAIIIWFWHDYSFSSVKYLLDGKNPRVVPEINNQLISCLPEGYIHNIKLNLQIF